MRERLCQKNLYAYALNAKALIHPPTCQQTPTPKDFSTNGDVTTVGSLDWFSQNIKSMM